MRFRWLALAVAAGVGICSGVAHAATNTEYLALREKTTITALPDISHITDQFSTRTGQIIEVEGQVSGVFSGEKGTGYLLRIDPKQTLVLFSAQNDADIAVGNTLHVLARIPAQGTMMESMVVTRGNPDDAARAEMPISQGTLPAENTAMTRIDAVPQDQPTIRYYRAPELTPQPRRAPVAQPPAVTASQPMASQPAIVQAYASRIQELNDGIDAALAQRIATCLLKESEEHNIDPRLVFAVVTQESRFNPRAVSYAGAMGLGQLMPGTAAGLGVHDPFNVSDNLCGTVRYLSTQLNRFGRLSLALAAYNAGPGAVNRYGGIPPYRQTQNYVSRIWRHYAKLCGIDPETGRQIAAQ